MLMKIEEISGDVTGMSGDVTEISDDNAIEMSDYDVIEISDDVEISHHVNRDQR